MSEVSTAMMYPSRINVYIELTFTRRDIVAAGLGHQSAGAANIASGFS